MYGATSVAYQALTESPQFFIDLITITKPFVNAELWIAPKNSS